ncbi:MAG: phosphatase PAP2 family protein [Alphaproteobacteria bacterium]|nr:phosphatase PAP2 family protein [Alphaproteobacteria bacterium]
MMLENEKLNLVNHFKLPFLFLILFAVWAFMTFSGSLATFDLAGMHLFRASAGDPIGPAWFEKLIVGLTHVGDSITLIIVSVVALCLLVFKKQKQNALVFTGLVGGVFALTPLLKSLFGRARPDVVDHLVHASSASFPSGHALRSAVVYLALLTAWQLYSRKGVGLTTRVLVFVLIFGIGLSRVYLGVHWPSDIIASWLLTFFWFLVWAPLFRKTR